MENESLFLYQAGRELQNNNPELICLILSFLYVTIALHCLSLIIVGEQSCVTRAGGVACTKVKKGGQGILLPDGDPKQRHGPFKTRSGLILRRDRWGGADTRKSLSVVTVCV